MAKIKSAGPGGDEESLGWSKAVSEDAKDREEIESLRAAMSRTRMKRAVRLLRLREQGRRPSEIAEQLEVSEDVVFRMLREAKELRDREHYEDR